MKHEIPTFDDFQMVKSIASHKTIQSSAKELGISPSTLSRQLSLLENKLGMTIFERNTRNLSLTASGKEFVQAASKVLDTKEKVMEEFNTHLRARSNQLRIASLPSLTGVLLPKLLNEFMASNPGVKLHLYDCIAAELIKAIEKNEVDLGFTVGTNLLKDKLSFMPIFKDEFIAVSGKNDSVINKKAYTLDEIVKLPVISAKRGTGIRELIELACEQRNLTFEPRVEVSHVSSAVALVSECLGICLIPTHIVPFFRTDNLKFHKIVDFNISRKFGIAYPSGESLNPVAEQFIKFARNRSKPLYQSIKKSFRSEPIPFV